MFLKKSRFGIFSIFLLALTMFSFHGKIHAQLDPSFGTNGVVNTELGGAGTTLSTFVLPDGKILVVATAQLSNQWKTFFIRYNSDGTLDANYGTNGKVQLAIPFVNPDLGRIVNAARQSDGKIIVVGYDVFNKRVPLIARLNDNGTLDTTFAGGSGISKPTNVSQFNNAQFDSALIYPDGKILIYGGAEIIDTTYPELALMRYHSNGSVDTSFGPDGTGFIVHTSIRFAILEGRDSFFLQSTGKIVLSARGEFSDSPGEIGAIRRFNADGTFDNGFTPISYTQTSPIQSLFVQPDDKILIGRRFTKTESLERVHTDSRISRYQADGAIDTSFGDGGHVSLDLASYSNDYPLGFQMTPDGQILVAHQVQIQSNRSVYRGTLLGLARLSPSGAVNGKLLLMNIANPVLMRVTVQPDGKILTAPRSVFHSGDGIVRLARAASVPLKNYVFHGVPFNFAAYLDATDIAVYRPGNNSFRFLPSITPDATPAPGDIIAPADYLGDLFSDLAYFRPSTGTWQIVRNFWGSGNDALTVRWGMAGDVPVPADYNGDGKADPAVFRPADGYWYIYHIADGSYSIVKWGIDGDKPVAGDYDGDGVYDRAVFRPATGEWWILRSSDNGYTLVQFGLPGDIPVQEDYDGDGKFDIAVYRPSNGVWYRINSSDASFFAFQWGLSGDVPIPGNYDQDNKANVAVWRPVNGGWYIVNPDYNSMFSYTWGVDGDQPLPAKY